jgi:hypothetical protein
MTAPFKTWTVLPHGPLTQVDDTLWTVVGEIHMPLGEFPRRMTVVRLADGRLVIYSAIALNPDEMEQLEALGTPAFLIVPCERHRLDAPVWKDRYPAIRVIAPPGAADKVSEVVTVDASSADFGDPNVQWVEVAGTLGHEAALEVTTTSGVTLIVNEIIGDIHGETGLKGWLLRLMGFAGDEPHVPAGPKLQFAKGKAELAAQMRRWAELPRLERIVVSHGDIIESEPREVLLNLAKELD